VRTLPVPEKALLLNKIYGRCLAPDGRFVCGKPPFSNVVEQVSWKMFIKSIRLGDPLQGSASVPEFLATTLEQAPVPEDSQLLNQSHEI